MARIVFGMAISHTPLMGCPPEQWPTAFRTSDENNTLLWFRKKHLTYDELVEQRAPERLERFLTDDEMRKRYLACIAAQDKLVDIYNEVKPDILVIIGNDHREVFTTVTPAFGVYTSAVHENGSVAPPALFEGVFSPAGFYGAQEPTQHPGVPELAQHVIGQLMADKFDVSIIEETPFQGDKGQRVVPHAFGFIYHHVFKDNPQPSLPIHINTFFPPNQPPIQRVFEFSESLVKAIRSWKTDKTVALVGSGGLTHFVVDEDLDRRMIDAFTTDIEKLKDIDELYYQSGTSEAKNWVPVAVAMRQLGVPMTLIDYVPCYRSPAGNGQGMTFAYWRP